MSNELWGQLAAGSIAGVAADGITHPVDTVRANLQYQKGELADRRLFREPMPVAANSGSDRNRIGSGRQV